MRRLHPRSFLTALSALALVACDDLIGRGSNDDFGDLSCAIPTQFVADGGPGKDGIPALTDPLLVPAGGPGTSYLLPEDRVIGLRLGSEYIAVPLNIGWWHEIVNLNLGDLHLAVTHCPLTGSSLVFDRGPISDAEFGVSGLLFMNNLLMYDRVDPESLWPQMVRGARCGVRTGTPLPMYPSIEMSWARWLALHPDTRVVSSQTGFARNYQSYPYGSYAELHNAALLAPMPAVDSRRPPKERVLGVLLGARDGVALPFGALGALGARAAVPITSDGRSAIVFWDHAAAGAAAFLPDADGQALTFRVEADAVVDEQTGSSWSVEGLALSGPLAGTRLTPVEDAFVAYWFAWSAFYPESVLWGAAP